MGSPTPTHLDPQEPLRPPPHAPAQPASARPEVRGKFLCVGGEKRYVTGVTYGPFRPGPDGEPYDRVRLDDDFAAMRQHGVNTIRLYTLPPRWLLDAATRHGLHVMAGLAWEQHVAFLDDRRRADAIVQRAGEQVAAVAGHPALLAWAVGNEIPAPIVRWSGTSRVREHLARLHGAVKAADPGALVTYVNYPTTEYLELDFLDFVCFNVFLEQPQTFDAYLGRLQNVADERPLILTEIGLDGGKHGERAQAESIAWQLRAAFAGGCAGAFVFSWTDEWHRGGQEIEDWHFGVTDRARTPKPALAAMARAFADVPVAPAADLPRVSVIVCTYNGSATLAETSAAIAALDYPDVEVIVVDDGSTDASADIARSHGFTVISTPNGGLSSARNTGLQAASGEIVAYLDDDAAPDPHWLRYLTRTFARSEAVAVGGPNLAVPGDGAIADAVAASPGNPSHVLITDDEAEHIPGCNCAFRVDALRAIGGFDPAFRTAGDDVDVCWRLQADGGTIAFSPAAVVWHHRRRSLRAYLRQQRGYGRAEAALERKWPERYSAGGHVTWAGRIYGNGVSVHPTGPLRWRVYHGVWGTAPFQALYAPAVGTFDTVLLMPEVYLAIGCLALIVALGLLWAPLLFVTPVLAVVAGGLAVRAIGSGARARFPTSHLSRHELVRRRALTSLLHLIQPLARLEGRLRHGLTPWRQRASGGGALPRPRRLERWFEEWADSADRVRAIERAVVAEGVVVRRGGDFDGWDLEARGGTLAGARIWTAVEEHGSGKQLLRVRCRPTLSHAAIALTLVLLALCAAAAASGAVAAAAVLGLTGGLLGLRTLAEASSAIGVTVRAVRSGEEGP
jgi:GT2 family glycosyltransferase